MMKRILLPLALVAMLSSAGCSIAGMTLGALADHTQPKPKGEAHHDTGFSGATKGFLIGAAVDLAVLAVLGTALDSTGTPCLGPCSY